MTQKTQVRYSGETPDRPKAMQGAVAKMVNRVSKAGRATAQSVSTRGGTPSAMSGEPGSFMNILHRQYAPLAYYLTFEVLEYVELLATHNPDFSQAVDIVRTLANSGHNLTVTAGTDGKRNRAKELIEEKAESIQKPHGGVDGLIDKLLDQAATYGAMCGEWVLAEDLSDVVDFVDVNPKSIRFFWSDEWRKWMPYQKVKGTQAKEAEERGQKVVNGSFVELNPLTFHYFAFDAAPGSPYGTPPFIAALQPIGIQRDMVANMSQIVKKIGLLGIIDAVVEQLPTRAGETDDEYAARAGQYLADYATVIEETVRDGGVVHFDDVQITATALSGNAAGATNIFKQNEEQVFSGLKSMPSVQGRSYSTTETYAGVAYDIIIRNTARYQRGVKRMIEAGYNLALVLDGQKARASISFKDNKTLQRLQKANAEAIEINNELKKWAAGITDQTQAAHALGYDKPATPYDEVPNLQILSNGSGASEEEDNEEGGTPPASDRARPA